MTRVQDVYPNDRVSLREVGLRDGLQLVKTFPSTLAKQRWMRKNMAQACGTSRSDRSCLRTRFRSLPTCGKWSGRSRSSRRARHSAGAQRAWRQRCAGLRSGRNRIGGFGHRRAQPGQCQAVAGSGDRQPQTSVRIARREFAQADRQRCHLDGAGMFNHGSGQPQGSDEAGGQMSGGRRRFRGRGRTVGYSGPRQVGELTKAVVKLCGAKPVCVHLHDTRGMGIANASAALDAGARILDGSLGGLGGCPFAPGATGNVVFEDLVFSPKARVLRPASISRSLSACAPFCGRKCPTSRSMADLPAPGSRTEEVQTIAEARPARRDIACRPALVT